ncbi:gamma-glutamyltransferase [Acetobacter oeni]|uniref:Glutathione hydrolase proenzyme n=1 Tax=Acetobacter oeni TaxID=304077 RepID=A0A511XMC4_9PROT|nr:gamma-glutamyltransferase [Acetobacter oeni]MBB3884111.1 gamma-glutamyltranspeptidase/glutathione hydrolase [Acetobacter oeni]GBR02582.1 gamma-glutamyltransferase [Acetobacter oeni LMG 21952]GEN64094.1 gamma-glutamyltranspeptidase [Acetobacter oeni]
MPFNPFRGDRGYGWTGQTRSEVIGTHGLVATSQPLAAGIGLDILRHGGNAFDAAIATAAAINVVEPESAGMGGDLFMIAWVAKEHRLVALDSAGRAPSGATPEYFRAHKLNQVPYTGIQSVVVPGTVAGWDAIQNRYGTMTFKETLEPAARLAEEGFGVTERVEGEWQEYAGLLGKDPDTASVYLPQGKPPALYGIFRNPDLAKTFRLLEQGGVDVFYKGPVSEAIVKKSRALGGTFTPSDFEKIKPQWVTPLTTSYRGYDIYEMPPSTQGVAVLEALNLVEQCGPKVGIDPRREGPRSPLYWHLLIEAKKVAYADLRHYVGDPDFVSVPTAKLTSKAYAASQCAKINPRHAAAIDADRDPVGGTVYLTTADRSGNVVSLIFSVYDEFGSGITVPGYGFLLNNRGAQFSLDDKSPNVIAPGKRPFYTIIPGFVLKDNKPFLSLGVMYGDQQAQGQLQVLENMLDLGANPQAASDAARFSHSEETNNVVLESELYQAVGSSLKAMGHKVIEGNGLIMGGYQAIMIDPRSGVYRGASDHRKDGAAVGY